MYLEFALRLELFVDDDCFNMSFFNLALGFFYVKEYRKAVYYFRTHFLSDTNIEIYGGFDVEAFRDAKKALMGIDINTVKTKSRYCSGCKKATSKYEKCSVCLSSFYCNEGELNLISLLDC
jgi:hypothetical protein